MHQPSKDVSDGKRMRTPMLDISKDDILDDATIIDISKFNEQVEGGPKCALHTYTLHYILALDMVVYYEG